MKRVHSFKDYEESQDKSQTDSYAPPKYLVQPAKGDKGFALLKGFFKKVKKVMSPGIWSTQ